MEREALRGASPDAGEARELRDEVVDDGTEHGPALCLAASAVDPRDQGSDDDRERARG